MESEKIDHVSKKHLHLSGFEHDNFLLFNRDLVKNSLLSKERIRKHLHV